MPTPAHGANYRADGTITIRATFNQNVRGYAIDGNAKHAKAALTNTRTYADGKVIAISDRLPIFVAEMTKSAALYPVFAI